MLKPSLRFFCFLNLVLAVATSTTVAMAADDCPPAPKAGDPVKIFPLDEIRKIPRGTIAHAFTVFEGTTPECFSLRIEGVDRNGLGPQQDDIIFTPMAGRAANTNIVHGMSGSPVYLNGMLLGALSRDISLDYTVAPTGGITPAALMLENLEDYELTSNTPSSFATLFSGIKEKSNTSVAAGSGKAAVVQGATLGYSGFAPEVISDFGSIFKNKGFDLTSGRGVSAAGSGSATLADPTKIKNALAPGSMIVLPYISGDFSYAVAGTVTFNDGKHVLAFGHPFTGMGRTNLPMMTGEVVKIVDSSHQSFKITNGVDLVGTLVDDRASSVMGIVGQMPTTIPLVAELTTPSRSKVFHAQLAQAQNLLPEMVAYTVYNTLAAVNQSGDGYTYKLEITLKIKDHGEHTFSEMYVSEEGSHDASAKALGLWALKHVMAVTAHPNEPGEIESIKIKSEILPDVRLAQLIKVETTKITAKAGDVIPVTATFRLQGHRELVTHTFNMALPKDISTGRMTIQVSPSTKFVEAMGKEFGEQKPDVSLDDTLKILSKEKPNGALYAELSSGSGNSTKDSRGLNAHKNWFLRLVNSPKPAPADTSKNDVKVSGTSVASVSGKATAVPSKRAVPTPSAVVAMPLAVVMGGDSQSFQITVE